MDLENEDLKQMKELATAIEEIEYETNTKCIISRNWKNYTFKTNVEDVYFEIVVASEEILFNATNYVFNRKQLKMIDDLMQLLEKE